MSSLVIRAVLRSPVVKHFVPHALIGLALVALAADTLPEKVCLYLLVGAHLLVPIWSAAIARRETRLRDVVLGPGIVIGCHAIGLLLAFLSTIGGVPEGTWLTMMLVILWALALAAYTVYCVIAFSIVMRARGSN
jgi:hypothetical protein